MRLPLILAVLLPCAAFAAPPVPTFYRDILPILQQRCQGCHRPGEIGPMPLLTYRQTRPWAKAIRDTVLARKMPPWFADPRFGQFSNDPSLSADQIQAISAWAVGGAPAGSLADSPDAAIWPRGWNIGQPNAIVRMPQAFELPAAGEIDYQYFIVPAVFPEDRWVQKVEVRPGNRAAVHHAVVYIREPGSAWLRDRPAGAAFTVPSHLPDGSPNPMGVTTSDILFTYTPGNAHDQFPPGMAKLIKAGSDLVFQMHYTATRQCCADRTSVGMVFAEHAPAERVLTLQLNNSHFLIPPGHPNYHVTVSGTLPNDAKLLSLYPHMHLRGKAFEYSIETPGGMQPLLKVNNYNFYWQLTYRLAQPLILKAGSRLECVATFDNSRNNPKNPDPDSAVRYGYRSSDEMVIGFFDVAVPANVDKNTFFDRTRH